jgi:hypothetical protein
MLGGRGELRRHPNVRSADEPLVGRPSLADAPAGAVGASPERIGCPSARAVAQPNEETYLLCDPERIVLPPKMRMAFSSDDAGSAVGLPVSDRLKTPLETVSLGSATFSVAPARIRCLSETGRRPRGSGTGLPPRVVCPETQHDLLNPLSLFLSGRLRLLLSPVDDTEAG